MGQQQLLLLVLGMVIVGIAVVAGIQAFSEGKAKADRDAAISDAMRIISDIQAWKLKPVAFGGGANGSDTDFQDVNFAALGISTTGDAANLDNDKYETLNGCFALSGSTTEATLTVYEPRNEDGTSCGDAIATVTIDGTTVADIEWDYATGSGS